METEVRKATNKDFIICMLLFCGSAFLFGSIPKTLDIFSITHDHFLQIISVMMGVMGTVSIIAGFYIIQLLGKFKESIKN